ncbi:MAG TPA: AsmA-like C-terminal region-containing protein [Pedobacter sp.]|uniref:AsmA family protein n=1 Tax=Pedobacter sp. TaxID=1411316 RepID=UPI002B7E86EE|nr:AsmA-like C-terminal region-containing protein [Pedobacter sp.]HMI02015.1 AsmA-like C-terminal region-containing protein [Pedobacter sp.]
MPRWSKIALKVFGILVGLVLIVYIGAAIYVTVNKKELLINITKKLNKNLNGSMTIESMDPTFLGGFPGISIKLKNVLLKDKLWNQHKHTLLAAKDFEVALNTTGLLTGTIEIEKIGIGNAAIYLFTDSNGYSNTSIFKKKDKTKKEPRSEESSSMEIGKITLNNVNFIMDNQRGHKLFEFVIDDLKAKVDYSWSDWEADVQLKAFAKSLAFNTRRGSFIKDKLLEGPFEIKYTDGDGMIRVAPNTLDIGKDPFVIGAAFDTSKESTDFKINIEVKKILWRNASALLAPNITSKLNMFNLDKPIHVFCTIAGNMGPGGDPGINVKAIVKNNVLTTPGGVVDDCSFAGMFTNNFVNGKGLTDANSAIKLYGFKGKYKELPFSIDTASINDLDNPVATGVFKSKFDIAKLNNVIGDNMLKFGKGTAGVELAYKADIVNFVLTKPYVKGIIDIKQGDVTYVPRKVSFKNTDISLNFTDRDLFIKNIRLQTGRSVVLMDGSIRNFLNLYYTAPEKIQLNWKIRSPQIHLEEFLGFLGTRKPKAKKRTPKSNFSDNLNEAFEMSQVNMNVRVNKVYYKKFLATNANADLLLSESGIAIRNVTVEHAGGSLKLSGGVTQKQDINRFTLNAILSNVDIRHFFYAFDNFGLKSLTSKNLRGYLFSKTNIRGMISEQGKLLPKSLTGSVIFDLKNGALVSFEPVKSAGKFAFPFRNLDNITFSSLNGKFDIDGEKVTINPMQISSSLLNMDIAGIYSMGSGTNIALDVPLRNPKKDQDITDRRQIKERRMKGIVLHLLATDGEDGKIKIKLNRNRNKT